MPAHLPALDGIRGLAIALVLIHQLGSLQAVSGLHEYVFSYVIGVGWIGVQLFFVLSGFLITGILLDTQGARNYLGGFFARRSLRIFPLYFLTLVFAFVILPLAGVRSASLAHDTANQFWLWFYLEDWATVLDHGSRTFPHYWSLAVEEQFYLVWPFLLRGRTASGCLRICLSVALASLLVRCIIGWNGPVAHDVFYYPSVCRADALALGGAAAAAFRVPAWRDWIISRRAPMVAIACVIGVAGAVPTHRYSLHDAIGQTAGYFILAVVFALLVTAAAAGDTARGGGWLRAVRWQPLRTLGRYSYAMYIFHKPLHDLVGKPLLADLGANLRESLVQNLAYIALSTMLLFLAASLSYRFLESRFLGMKDRFAPARARD